MRSLKRLRWLSPSGAFAPDGLPLEKWLRLESAHAHRARALCNLLSGGTNPDAIRDLQVAIGDKQVRHLRHLHAKVFIGDGAAIVGSANVSMNGLGAEGGDAAFWEEAATYTEDPAAVTSAREWFERLWKASEPVTAEVMEEARRRYEKRRSALPPTTAAPVQLSELIASRRSVAASLPLYLVTYEAGQKSEAAAAALDRVREDATWDAYEEHCSARRLRELYRDDAYYVDCALVDGDNEIADRLWYIDRLRLEPIADKRSACYLVMVQRRAAIAAHGMAVVIDPDARQWLATALQGARSDDVVHIGKVLARHRDHASP